MKGHPKSKGILWGPKDCLVPAAPLIRQLELAGAELSNGSLVDNAVDHGYRELCRRYARRFPEIGYGPPSRQIYRLMRQERVYLQAADRWCAVLGIHPVMLWPELYREKAA